MICVNAKRVDGRAREEPAAKGLREVVYQDPRVIEKSKEFVCVLLTQQGSAADFGELRALGISGDIVSPQHIFVQPDGQKIVHRVRYWRHGQGESGILAFLAMMAKAQENLAGAGNEASADDGGVGPVPESGADRVEWIARMIQQVVGGSAKEHEAALQALVQNDKDGDCIAPLVALLEEHAKNTGLVNELIRALGRDGLEIAALPVAKFLSHKAVNLRANAAVSLEYIGSQDKKVVAALRKAVGKEKDEAIANHMYRALGRCGVKDTKVRSLLLKKADSAKSEFASFGPLMGLAYFEGDPKAARGVEKILKKIGVPGSRRGGGQNTVKRGVMSWTLAAIGDEKSGAFVREELIEKLENVQAFWVEGLRTFYGAVAAKCDGDASAMAGIEEGVRGFVGFAKRFDLGRYGAETRALMDEYREGRDNATFKPKGDGLLGIREED